MLNLGRSDKLQVQVVPEAYTKSLDRARGRALKDILNTELVCL